MGGPPALGDDAHLLAAFGRLPACYQPGEARADDEHVKREWGRGREGECGCCACGRWLPLRCLGRVVHLWGEVRALRPGQVVGVEHIQVDQLIQAFLAQLLAPQHRQQALPALLEKVAQRGIDPHRVVVANHRQAAQVVQHAGRPQRAEAALARPHAQAGFTADVIQGLRLALHDGAFNIRIGGQLALADQPAVRLPLFDGLQAVAQIVRFRISCR